MLLCLPVPYTWDEMNGASLAAVFRAGMGGSLDMVRAILKEEGFAGLFAGRCHAVDVVGMLVLDKMEYKLWFDAARVVHYYCCMYFFLVCEGMGVEMLGQPFYQACLIALT